jgi:hypothetical protein
MPILHGQCQEIFDHMLVPLQVSMTACVSGFWALTLTVSHIFFALAAACTIKICGHAK